MSLFKQNSYELHYGQKNDSCGFQKLLRISVETLMMMINEGDRTDWKCRRGFVKHK